MASDFDEVDFLRRVLSYPPQTCNSCRQTSHDYDKDLLDTGGLSDYEMRVKWHRFDRPRNHDMRDKPSAHCCSRCWNVRRFFYPEMKEKEFVKKLEEPGQRELFDARRHDRVSGKRQLEPDRENTVTSTVDMVKEDYNDKFEELTFLPLRIYCRRLNHGHLRTYAEMKAFAESNGCEVIQDDEGTYGVEIAGEEKGVYKIRRGKGQRVQWRQSEKNVDEGVAGERMGDVAGHMAMDPMAASSAGDGLQSREASPVVSAPRLVHLGTGAAPSLLGRAAAAEPSPLSPGRRSHRQERTASRSRSPSTSTLRTTRSGGRRGAVAPPATCDDPNLQSSLQNHDDAAVVAGGRQGARPGAAEAPKTIVKARGPWGVVASAEKLLGDAQEEITSQSIWSFKHRPRDLGQWPGRLAAMACKVGSMKLAGEEEKLASLSQRCFDASERIEKDIKLFKKVRAEARHFVKCATTSDTEHLLKLPCDLLGEIITYCGEFLLKDVEDASFLETFLSFLSATLTPLKDVTGLRIGCLWHAGPTKAMSETQLLADMEKMQRTLLLSFVERVVKLPPIKFVNLFSSLEGGSAYRFTVAGGGAMDEKGFFETPFHDIEALRACATLLSGMETNGEQKTPQELRSLRATATRVHAMRGTLSTRLRAITRMSTSGGNCLRTAWEQVENLTATTASQQQLQETARKSLETIAKLLALGEEANDDYVAVAHLVNNMKDVTAFHEARMMTPEDAPEASAFNSLGLRIYSLARNEFMVLVSENGAFEKIFNVLEGLTITAEEDAEKEKAAVCELCEDYKTMTMVLQLLQTCDTDMTPAEHKWVSIVYDRVKMIWDVMSGEEPTGIEKIQKYAELWPMYQKMPTSSTEVLPHDMKPLQTLNNNLLKISLDGVFTREVRKIMLNTAEDDAEFAHAFQKVENLLPPKTVAVFRHGRVWSQCTGLQKKLQAGESIGVVELLAHCSSLEDAELFEGENPTYSMRPTRGEGLLKLLLKETERVVKSTIAKVNVARFIEFYSKFKPVLEGAKTWDFTGMDWLAADEKTDSPSSLEFLKLATTLPGYVSIVSTMRQTSQSPLEG